LERIDLDASLQGYFGDLTPQDPQFAGSISRVAEAALRLKVLALIEELVPR
jgi:hypothetical protein